jgi:hypothetical protein
VGKGSGNRYRVSGVRIGGIAGITEFFPKESQALAKERQLIARYQPEFNKTSGGEGKSKKRYPSPEVLQRRKKRQEERIAAKWAEDAYERADKTGYALDLLAAAAYARCELNQRGIRCQQEEEDQARADPRVASMVKRLHVLKQSNALELLRSNICCAS